MSSTGKTIPLLFMTNFPGWLQMEQLHFFLSLLHTDLDTTKARLALDCFSYMGETSLSPNIKPCWVCSEKSIQAINDFFVNLFLYLLIPSTVFSSFMFIRPGLHYSNIRNFHKLFSQKFFKKIFCGWIDAQYKSKMWVIDSVRYVVAYSQIFLSCSSSLLWIRSLGFFFVYWSHQVWQPHMRPSMMRLCASFESNNRQTNMVEE